MDDSSVIIHQVTQTVDNLTESGRHKEDFILQKIKSILATDDVDRPPSAVNSVNPAERSSVIRYDQQRSVGVGSRLMLPLLWIALSRLCLIN